MRAILAQVTDTIGDRHATRGDEQDRVFSLGSARAAEPLQPVEQEPVLRLAREGGQAYSILYVLFVHRIG